MTYTLWISDAKDLDICEEGNDLLRFGGLSWNETMLLMQIALQRGFLCILDAAGQEA